MFGVLSLGMSGGIVYAAEPASEWTLFLSQDCAQCDSVLAEYETLAITTVEILYIEDPVGESRYSTAIESCTLTGQPVPMLYSNGECTVGDSTVIARMNEIAQSESDNSASDSTAGEVEEIPTENEQESDGDTQEETRKPTEISPLVLIASLVAPILLIGIGYYLITKLKL